MRKFVSLVTTRVTGLHALRNQYLRTALRTVGEGIKMWKKKKCTTWKQIIVGNSFNFKRNAQPYIVKHNMDCNSHFVLYELTCQDCGENYIGETRKNWRERMTLHRQHIRSSEYRILAATAHIEQCAANETIKFTVFPFYKMTHENDDARRAKEQYFIKKFKPSLNST